MESKLATFQYKEVKKKLRAKVKLTVLFKNKATNHKKHRNTQNGSKSTNHKSQTTAFRFPRFAKM